MLSQRLRRLQLATAVVLLPLILVHIGLVVFVIVSGASAAEIIGRIEGSIGWALYYGAFVIALAIHGPIGMRNVLLTWTSWRGSSLDVVACLLMIGLSLIGLKAIVAVSGCLVLICL